MKSSGGIRFADATRAEFSESVSDAELQALATQPELRVLQCSKPVPNAVWMRVNEHICIARPDVQIRVYGHESMECDLGFARLLSDAQHFAADCLMSATSIEAIAEIKNLKSLSLGIFGLRNFRVLEQLPTGLRSLSLGATKSKRPSLDSLRGLRSLRNLYLEGQSRCIEVLSELPELEDLTLRSISQLDLKFMQDLPRLWSLAIKLGGMHDFTGIEGKESMKYLELWQVRGLKDLEVVGTLHGLQNLFVQSLPNVESFPRVTQSKDLRRIVVESLKGLRDFEALEAAPALEEFALIDGRMQTPKQLLPVLRNPCLRRGSAGFGSDRKNREFERLREEHGKANWGQREAFEYK